MMATLPGIDANDPRKTLACFRLYCVVLSSVGTLQVQVSQGYLPPPSPPAGCLPPPPLSLLLLPLFLNTPSLLTMRSARIQAKNRPSQMHFFNSCQESKELLLACCPVVLPYNTDHLELVCTWMRSVGFCWSVSLHGQNAPRDCCCGWHKMSFQHGMQ